MSPIEKLLFKKVELWLLLLLLFLGSLGGMLMLVMVADGARGGAQFGALSRHLMRQAAKPLDILQQLQSRTDLRAKEQRFGSRGGWIQHGARKPEPGEYLLLSRHSGDEQRAVVELVAQHSGEILHRWVPDIEAINALSKLPPNRVNLARDFGPARYSIIHPLPTRDGGLVFSGMGSPLVKIDACSQVVWTVDGIYHHAKETDSDGQYWVSSRRFPSPFRHEWAGPNFRDDEIARVSPTGEVILQRSIMQILIDNGLQHLVRGMASYDADPIHSNDIQPVPGDGPYWKQGDVFLSLRHLSLVALYRPSSNLIVWHKTGPWVRQHDVNIINQHQISVFNNNKLARRGNQDRVEDANDIVIYDFATDSTRSPFAAGLARHEVRTIAEGNGRVLESGDAIVEETEQGRLLRLAENGEMVWEYINRAEDGRVYRMNWSRPLENSDWPTTVLDAAQDCRL